MVVVSNEPYGTVRPALNIKKTEDLSIQKNEHSFNDTRSHLPPDALLLASPAKVLDILTNGVKEQNITVVKQCIYNLDQRLDQTNALFLFRNLSKYVTSTNNNYEPSAPPLDEHSNWLQDLIQNLRHNCLLEIDKHADFILNQSEILQLSYNDLLSIMERDTLQVSSETLVYVTVYRWATNECHQQGLNELDLTNLKNILQRLQYSPRYGLISKTKFVSKIIGGVPGPTRSGILNEKDWRLIKFYLDDKAKNRPVKDLPHKWSMPRISCKNSPKEHTSACSSPSGSGRNRTACEKCIINFLSCWTAVFD